LALLSKQWDLIILYKNYQCTVRPINILDTTGLQQMSSHIAQREISTLNAALPAEIQ